MFTRNLRSWVAMLKEGEIFLAKNAYQEYFSDMEEATFYQLLARIYKEKCVGKLAKGLYYRPYYDDYNREPSIDKVLDFFTNKYKNGTVVGQYMLADLGLITNPQGKYEVYTNCFEIKTQRIMGDAIVKSVKIDYKNPRLLYCLRMLEIVEIIDDFENVNLNKLFKFMVEFATNFDQQSFMKVLEAKNYKKRNVACIYEILTHFRVQNTLVRLLNSASKYNESKNIRMALEKGEA